MLWWCTRRAPSTGGSFHTGASLQRSRPVPGRWYFTYERLPPGAVDRVDDVPALWQAIFGVPVGFISKFQASLSSGSFSGRAVLALVRPVVPYTLALILTALSAGDVSGSALYSSALCRPVVTPELLKQADSSSSESSPLFFKLEVIPKRPKLPRKHKT